jgi:hypothetical protein
VRRFVFWAEQGGAGALAAQSEPPSGRARGIGLLADERSTRWWTRRASRPSARVPTSWGRSQTDAAAHVHAALVAAARLLGGLRGDGAPRPAGRRARRAPGAAARRAGAAVRAAFQQAAAALPAR